MNASRLVQRSDDEATPARARADELLTRVALGDRKAFEELFDLFQSRVFGLSLVLVRDRHQAEEVAQEVFLHLWQRAGRFDHTRGGATHWILQITRSKSIDRIRHSQSARMRDAGYASGSYVADVDSTLESVLMKDEHTAVYKALQGLSEKQREALFLTFYRTMSAPEISDLLGVPTPTIKSRIRDGLIRLRSVISLADMDVDQIRPSDWAALGDVGPSRPAAVEPSSVNAA